jgi:hypothetical protein
LLGRIELTVENLDLRAPPPRFVAYPLQDALIVSILAGCGEKRDPDRLCRMQPVRSKCEQNGNASAAEQGRTYQLPPPTSTAP